MRFLYPYEYNSLWPMSYEVILLSDMSQSNLWSRPLAPYRLATELRANNFSTLVINGLSDFSESELLLLLKEKIGSETLFIGVSSTFVSSRTTRGFIPGARTEKRIDLGQVFTGIKDHFPRVKIVLGGANTSFFLASSFADKIDYFVFGYSDQFIVQMASAFKSETEMPSEIVNGHKVIRTDNEQNSQGISSFTAKYLREDKIFENETLVLELSRGCRFKCKFCAYPMNGRKSDTFLKDKDALRTELIRNYELYNIKNYILSDDTYNESLEKIKYFGNVFQSLPFKINFATYLRLDLINSHPESIDILKNSGLGGAFFGIESLYEPAARAVGKGLSAKKTIELLDRLKSYWGNSVNLTGSFIVGLPHDTKETITDWLLQISEKTFPLDHASVNPLMIGNSNSQNPWKSEFQKNPEKNGYTIKDQINQKKKGAVWENSNLTSELASELVINYYNNYFKNSTRTYDTFNYQTLKGYNLNFLESIPLINDMKHQNYIDKIVNERVNEYKIQIFS